LGLTEVVAVVHRCLFTRGACFRSSVRCGTAQWLYDFKWWPGDCAEGDWL